MNNYLLLYKYKLTMKVQKGIQSLERKSTKDIRTLRQKEETVNKSFMRPPLPAVGSKRVGSGEHIRSMFNDQSIREKNQLFSSGGMSTKVDSDTTQSQLTGQIPKLHKVNSSMISSGSVASGVISGTCHKEKIRVSVRVRPPLQKEFGKEIVVFPNP